MRIIVLNILICILFLNNAYSDNNYLDADFSPNDIDKIKKIWEYKSGVLKSTQSKPEIYEDKIVFLDGLKNLRVISILDGKEVCVNNNDKPDRGPQRGVLLYNKSEKKIYSIFFRHNQLTIIDINNCKEIKLKNKIKIKQAVSSKLLIHKEKLIILINGSSPRAYSLTDGKLIWKGKLSKEKNDELRKINLNKNFSWDVWGGGVIDDKYNQIIFSTANPKPSFISIEREGPNLFSNSVVAVDLDTGLYKWHFQEISHDLLNLDLASPPVLYKENVLQASKNGQLIVLDRKDGKNKYDYTVLEFKKLRDANTITKYKKFEDWLIFSRQNFFINDINNLDRKYKDKAEKIISDSIVNDQKKLVNFKNYIFYGMHGGAEWPGIAVNPKGLVAIPSNNIAWVGKLNNPDEFDFKENFSLLFKEFKFFFFNDNKKKTIKKIIKISSNIINFKTVDIEKYKKFVSSKNIPLNKPPWGTLTLIDIKNNIKMWQVPHGDYSFLDDKLVNTGAEIFGSPIITAGGVIFLSGTEDQKIRAYDLRDGKEIWSDKLPFVSYGKLSFAKYKNKNYLIILCTGGSKFKNSKQGDALVVYQLN